MNDAPPPPPPPAPDDSPVIPTGRPAPGPRALASRVTLSARMVALVVVVLTAGLALSTAAATAQLRTHLLDEIDEQLEVALRSSEGMLLDDLVRSINRTTLESDLQLSLQIDGRQVSTRGRNDPRWGTPAVPLLAPASPQLGGLPFTLEGLPAPDGTSTRWRAVARPVVSPDERFLGAVVVALPVAPATQTTSELAKVLGLVSALLVTAAASFGYLAVRRSLRPLREIEATARHIAEGDLSSRIPDMPPTTEVGAVAQSLNIMLARIQESFDERAASQERMRRFVSDASHELRTPLVSIRGYAELYRMGAVTTPEQTAESMGRIESAAVQMGALVEDLLALARLDERRELTLTDVDVAALAADALADLRAMDPGRATTLVVLGPDGEPVPDDDPRVNLRADAARLRQVLTNLVGNVQRHTPAGSPAEVVVTVGETSVQVAVRDHGPGVPREHREAVFERFHRVDASRSSASGGSGLGLAIVRSIVLAHGGAVEVAETPGGGATVVVSLPRG